MSRIRLGLTALGGALVIGAAVVVVWSAASTSSARLTASTSGTGFFAAGTIDLVRSDRAVGLLFDADGLSPGRVLSSCVEIDYNGSVPADVRLFASRSGGTGLAQHVELRLWVRTTGRCPADGSVGGTARPSGPPLFVGRLTDLWGNHPDHDRGLELVGRATDGTSMILQAEAELVGGEAAQGLTTEFAVVIEARP